MAEPRNARRALPLLGMPSNGFMHRGTAEITDPVIFFEIHP